MPQPFRTLCLGETLVDLICEQPVGDFADARAFVPQFGGATANVAVNAARHGARIGLASAVGDDPWGRWLRARLAAEDVDLSWFRTVDGIATPLACIAVDARAEPTFSIYGDGIALGIASLLPDIAAAVASFDGLFFGSNTLVGPLERAVTEQARTQALRDGLPIVIDANLRLERWPDRRQAIDTVRAVLPGALLIRANVHEAQILTGRADPEAAARGLLELGARAAVVTLGAAGALLVGDDDCRVPGVPSTVRSTVGAGDAVNGVLVAALTLSGYDPSVLADALPEAVAAGARATEHWGALPPSAGVMR